jgi:hypothetical protein
VSDTPKNRAAVALGRKGGKVTSERKAAAVRANGRKPKATGGTSDRWPVALRLEPDERRRAVATAEARGLTVGEWIAGLVRDATRGG